MNQAIQLRVNEKNLVRHLRLAFTSKTTFLAELMQNARRAGASWIKIFHQDRFGRGVDDGIVIIDNGHGIADMQNILSVAESGWDADVMDTETPYGIGFLSALFAAKRVKIESRNQCVEFDTRDALGFEAIPVKRCKLKAQTRITLTGLDVDKADNADIHIEGAAAAYAKGFPIPVIFNGQALPRPHSLERGNPHQLRFIETGIGMMHIPDADRPEATAGSALGTERVTVYLQGLPIYRSTSYRLETSNVIHLDPRQFKGRLPDRDTLVNEREAVNRITKTIRGWWEARLRELSQTLPAKQFAAQFYATLKHWGCVELLDDNPWLPGEVLRQITDYPCYEHDWESWTQSQTGLALPADEISQQLSPLVSLENTFSYDEPYQDAMYAWKKKAQRLDGRLGSNHWVHSKVIEVTPENVEVHLIEPRKEATFVGNQVDCDVVFCKEARLAGPCGDVIIDDYAFVVSDTFVHREGYPASMFESGYLVVIPDKEGCGDVVGQLSSFLDEWDSYLEDRHEEETALFESFILANRAGEEVKALRRLLDGLDLHRYASFTGKTFTVTIGDEWKPGVGSRLEVALQS